MKTKEFASHCGVSVRTVERWIMTGKVTPTSRTAGGHARFTEKDHPRWQDQKEQSPGLRPETASTTSTGHSQIAPSRGSYHFVQKMLAKRRIGSRLS
ncbi:MAG: MerR family transcriptional regulator [Sneathiella sp.]